jgi:hypothetical protein
MTNAMGGEKGTFELNKSAATYMAIQLDSFFEDYDIGRVESVFMREQNALHFPVVPYFQDRSYSKFVGYDAQTQRPSFESLFVEKLSDLRGRVYDKLSSINLFSSLADLEGESHAKKLALQIFSSRLGGHCVDRLKLLMEYQNDWDGEGAKKLSYVSLLSCISFINGLDLSGLDKATVFMDYDGNLSLSWPVNDDDELLEIFFLPNNELKVYTEHDEKEERFYGLSQELRNYTVSYI